MGEPRQNKDRAKLWRPAGSRDVTLFKASFHTFAFGMHVHEEPAMGVIEQGVQTFRHKGAAQVAPPGSIITVNPDEPHDGRSAQKGGYDYRVVYVGVDFLSRIYGEMFPAGRPPAFRQPVTHDPELAGRFLAALRAAERAPHLVDELLPPVLFDLFARHASPKPLPPAGDPGPVAAALAVEYIREHAAANPSLDRLAGLCGLSKFHFLRVFKKATGLSPHAFVLGQRLALAKKSLEEGLPVSETALAAGFSDQSHLTRRFKASFGLTPAAFQKSMSRR